MNKKWPLGKCPFGAFWRRALNIFEGIIRQATLSEAVSDATT